MLKNKKAAYLFRNISNDLAENLLSLSKEEVFEEARERYEDPTARASQLRNELGSLIMECRKKNRLIPAKEALRHSVDDQDFGKKVISWTIEKLNKVLDKAFSDKTNLPEGLVLQFRQKKNLSKEDLVHLLENLHDLGLIDDDDM